MFSKKTAACESSRSFVYCAPIPYGKDCKSILFPEQMRAFFLDRSQRFQTCLAVYVSIWGSLIPLKVHFSGESGVISLQAIPPFH